MSKQREEHPVAIMIALVIQICYGMIWWFYILVVSWVEAIFGLRKEQVVNRDDFWHKVRLCLMEFHSMSYVKAMDAVDVVYAKPHDEAFFLQEPFDAANDIAGNDLRLSPEEYKTRYVDGILAK